MKLYGKCFMCKNKRLFIRKRKLSVGPNKDLHITSKEMLCTRCYKGIIRLQDQGKLT